MHMATVLTHPRHIHKSITDQLLLQLIHVVWFLKQDLVNIARQELPRHAKAQEWL